MSRNLTAQDRSALIRLASSLPVGSPERKAILAGLASLVRKAAENAEEPYQKVEGVPFNKDLRVDLVKVENKRELRQLTTLLDKLFNKIHHLSNPVLAPNEVKALQKWGVNPETFANTSGVYNLYVTDSSGTEYGVEDILN